MQSNHSSDSMKLIFSILFLVIGSSLFGQIDMQDSTATAIAYWQNGEQQNYKVTEDELIMSGEDTIYFNQDHYEVAIKVVDSNSVNYILEWQVSNLWSVEENAIKAQLFDAQSQIPFLILTNEYGADISVLNWEDVKTHMDKSCDSLSQIYLELPKYVDQINKYKNKYKSKESINEMTIKGAQQLFGFHGAKYKLGETIKGKIKLPNNYGGDPLSADAIMLLDEILPTNNTYILKFFQNVDPLQLKAVTYDYLKSLNIDASELPSFADFPTITKQIWGGTEIHSSTGWVIFSQESEQITTGSEITTKDRLIELVK